MYKMLPYVSIALLGLLSVLSSYVFIQFFTSSRKDGSLDRDILMMLIQVLKGVFELTFAPLTEFFTSVYGSVMTLVFNIKWFILLVGVVGLMLGLHFEHQTLLPDFDDCWRCVIYPFVRTFLLSFVQLIRLVYALLMPFANFLLIVSSQLLEGTALTLFKCSESALDDMIQSVVLFGKSLLLLFQSIAAFFGDASEDSNVLVNDLDLETPLEMMSKAVGVLEQPFICSCNQFTKPIQSLFAIIQSKFIPMIISASIELAIRSIQSFVLTFQGQFPTLSKVQNSLRRVVLNSGFLADEIAFITIEHILQTFDSSMRVTTFPKESFGAIAARVAVMGLDFAYMAYCHMVVAADMAVEYIFDTNILEQDRVDFLSAHTLMSNIDYMWYDLGNNFQFVLYVIGNFDKGNNPFDSIRTPVVLDCELSKVSLNQELPFSKAFGCFYYNFAKISTPIVAAPIPFNLLYVMYQMLLELFFRAGKQKIWMVLQRFAGMMIDLNTDASCLYRLESTFMDYSISAANCQCDRRFAYAYRYGEREYTPNCLQPTLNYDVLQPMDKASVYFWSMLLNLFSIGNVGKAFSGFYKLYFNKLHEAYGLMKEAAKAKRQDSSSKQPAEGIEEQIDEEESENPLNNIQFPVMQRYVIEMARLSVRFVLAVPDILFGHYFTYPMNCGWGLNRSRAIDFFNDKFNVKHCTGTNDEPGCYKMCSGVLDQIAEGQFENYNGEAQAIEYDCISEEMVRFTFCQQKEYRQRKYKTIQNTLISFINFASIRRKEYMYSIIPSLREPSLLTYNPKIFMCTKTNDNKDCICNPELYLTASSKCRCISHFPIFEALQKNADERDVFKQLVYSKTTAKHWCNSMFFEYSISLLDTQLDLQQWVTSFSWITSANGNKCIGEPDGDKAESYVPGKGIGTQTTLSSTKKYNPRVRYIQTYHRQNEEHKKRRLGTLPRDAYADEQKQKYIQEQAAKDRNRKSFRNSSTDIASIASQIINVDKKVTDAIIQVEPIVTIDQERTGMNIQYKVLQTEYALIRYEAICSDAPEFRIEPKRPMQYPKQHYNQLLQIPRQQISRVVVNESIILLFNSSYYETVYSIDFLKKTNMSNVNITTVGSTYINTKGWVFHVNVTFDYFMINYEHMENTEADECCEQCVEEECRAWSIHESEKTCTLFYYIISREETIYKKGYMTGFKGRVKIDLNMPKPLMYGRSVFVIAASPAMAALSNLNTVKETGNAAKCIISAYYGPFCNMALVFRELMESNKMNIRLMIKNYVEVFTGRSENAGEADLLFLCQNEKVSGALAGMIGTFFALIIDMIGAAVGAIGDAFGDDIGFKTTPNIKRLLTRIVFAIFDGTILWRDRLYVYLRYLSNKMVVYAASLSVDSMKDLIIQALISAFDNIFYIVRQVLNIGKEIDPGNFFVELLKIVDIVQGFLNRQFVDIFALLAKLFLDFFSMIVQGTTEFVNTLGKVFTEIGRFIFKIITDLVFGALPWLSGIRDTVDNIASFFGSERLGAPHEFWTPNTECGLLMHYAKNKTFDTFTTSEKIIYVQCYDQVKLAKKVFDLLKLKFIPDDILYNWKRKYIILYQIIHAVFIYIRSDSDEEFVLLMEEYGLNYRMTNEIYRKTIGFLLTLYNRLSIRLIFETILKYFDHRYKDPNNPSSSAKAYRLFDDASRSFGDISTIWHKHHMGKRIYVSAQDMLYMTHKLFKQSIKMVNETHVTALKNHVFKQFKHAKNIWYADQPVVTKLRSFGSTDKDTCNDREGSCIECTLLNNFVDLTNETSKHMSIFYSKHYNNISNNVEEYFTKLNQTTRTYVNDVIDRLLEPEPHEPWYKHVEQDWIDLYNNPEKEYPYLLEALKLVIVTVENQTNVTRNGIVTNNTYVPFFGYGIPYVLQYPFTTECDIETMIYQGPANRVELFDNAFYLCLVIDIIILFNGWWSVIPLSPLLSIAIMIPVNYFLFLYEVYGFVPNCAPALPVMLVEDAYMWTINRLIPACFCSYFPLLATKCPVDTCERCIPKNYTYGNCNELLVLNASSSVSYNLVDEVSVFWNLFYVARRDFPQEYAFFVKEGYLDTNSAIGVLGMQAWQNTPYDPVWDDCHNATYLNFVVTIGAIVTITLFVLRLSIALIRSLFNLLFLSWNVLLFVSYTTQALDASTVSKK